MNITLECYTCRKEQAVEVNNEPSLAVELCGIADSIGWKSLLNLRTGKAYVFCCDECHDKQFTRSGDLRKKMIRLPKESVIMTEKQNAYNENPKNEYTEEELRQLKPYEMCKIVKHCCNYGDFDCPECIRMCDEEEKASSETKMLPFGDGCTISIPKQPIDCSKIGYFDELEYDCWELIKTYCAYLGIEIVSGDISFDIAKGIQDHIIEQFQKSGVHFKFNQDKE